MAVPKRRTSKSRKLKRRTHDKLTVVAAQPCPRCGEPKRPHRVCLGCGFYAGKKEIEAEEI
jgi:large subunit ribosomal protein L32